MLDHDLELENEWLKRENLALHNAVTELRRNKEFPWTERQRELTVEMLANICFGSMMGAVSGGVYLCFNHMIFAGVSCIIIGMIIGWCMIRLVSAHWKFWKALM